jgi:ABC-2 type transport system permease protein
VSAATSTRSRLPAGVPTLLRFQLRRERRALPVWVLVTAGLVYVQSVQSQSLYGTPEALAKLRATTLGNGAIVAMSGPDRLLETIGGEIVFEIFGFAAIVLALMSMFLVGRNTRADEETGRAELVRSARVSRHALLVTPLLVAVLANVTVGVLVALIGVATDLPAGGSLLFGAALASVGLVFTGLTALFAQVFENTRPVYGTVTALLGLSFALRAAGDAGTDALAWLSPLGWGQRTYPYVDDRWWPVVLALAVAGLLVAAAWATLERRDFAGGLVPARLGPPEAPRSLSTPLGLAWRLQRGALLGWAIGGFTLGVMFGSISKSIEQYVADNPEFAQYLPGGAGDVLDSFVAVALAVVTLLSVAAGISAALRARAEETGGRAEPVLATAVSRRSWLGGHVVLAMGGSLATLACGALGLGLAYGLSVSEPEQIGRTLAASAAYAPATLLAVAVAVAGVGLVPRLAAVVAWTLLGYMALVTLLADSFDLPSWSRQVSPLDQTPQVPLESATAMPLAVMAVLAVAVVALGLAGLARRDIETA